jgi:phage tail protein X
VRMTTPPRISLTTFPAALLAAMILLASCSADAASPSVAGSSAPSRTAVPSASTSAVAEELDHLVEVLERTHPDPYHGVARADFVSALDAFEVALPDMTAEEATVEMMRIWAMLTLEGRDGHQFALPTAAASGPFLPIRVYEFAEGVFVTGAAPPHEDLAGARITAVESTPIDDVLAAIEPLVPRDGPATVPAFRPFFFLRTDVLRGLGIADAGPVAVEVERDGATETVELDPIPLEEWTAWGDGLGMQQLPADSRVRYLADPQPYAADLLDEGVAYVRYRAVGHPDVARARAWFDAGQATSLVLDLRQNPGGDNRTYAPLLALVEDVAAANPGAVTVLTDRVTFSAAANLATEIEARTDARFVGEPMGGGLNFWNDVERLRLDTLPIPMEVAISVRYWQFAAPDDPRLTIEPDVAVEVTAADFFAGRDPALDAALSSTD